MNEKWSPAHQLIDIIWRSATGENGAGWSTYNQALSRGLALAVESGMRFDIGDLALFAADNIDQLGFRGSYWMGGGDNGHEWIYSTAIAVGNTSAALSYEAWKKRAPFTFDQILEGARISVGQGRSTPKSGRLHIGAVFAFDRKCWIVGSFSQDGTYINAQQRETIKSRWGDSSKLVRRRKITREELDKERLARAKAKRKAKKRVPE